MSDAVPSGWGLSLRRAVLDPRRRVLGFVGEAKALRTWRINRFPGSRSLG